MKKWGEVECIKTIGGVDVPTFKCLEGLFAQILNISISLAILALFVMLTMGGFKYLTAGADQKAVASARSTMTSAIAGIALMAVAFLIFRLIEYFTGVTITVFRIPEF